MKIASMMLCLKKMTSKTILFTFLLFLCSKIYAQEPDRVFIPRTFGSVELGEYVTEQMIMDSFGLDVRYGRLKLYDTTTYSVNTSFTFFETDWDELSIDQSNDDYSAISVSFTDYSENVSFLLEKYNQMRSHFCQLWGDGKVTSYGMSEITSIWEDTETVVRLCIIDRDDSVRLVLAFIDKMPVDSF